MQRSIQRDFTGGITDYPLDAPTNEFSTMENLVPQPDGTLRTRPSLSKIDDIPNPEGKPLVSIWELGPFYIGLTQESKLYWRLKNKSELYTKLYTGDDEATKTKIRDWVNLDDFPTSNSVWQCTKFKEHLILTSPDKEVPGPWMLAAIDSTDSQTGVPGLIKIGIPAPTLIDNNRENTHHDQLQGAWRLVVTYSTNGIKYRQEGGMTLFKYRAAGLIPNVDVNFDYPRISHRWPGNFFVTENEIEGYGFWEGRYNWVYTNPEDYPTFSPDEMQALTYSIDIDNQALVCATNEHLWLADSRVLRQSRQGQMVFPDDMKVEFESNITAISQIQNVLLVQTETGTYRVDGFYADDGSGSVKVRALSTSEGSISPYTSSTDKDLFFMSKNRISSVSKLDSPSSIGTKIQLRYKEWIKDRDIKSFYDKNTRQVYFYGLKEADSSALVYSLDFNCFYTFRFELPINTITELNDKIAFINSDGVFEFSETETSVVQWHLASTMNSLNSSNHKSLKNIYLEIDGSKVEMTLDNPLFKKEKCDGTTKITIPPRHSRVNRLQYQISGTGVSHIKSITTDYEVLANG